MTIKELKEKIIFLDENMEVGSAVFSMAYILTTVNYCGLIKL